MPQAMLCRQNSTISISSRGISLKTSITEAARARSRSCWVPMIVTAFEMESTLEKKPNMGLLASFRMRAVNP